MAGQALLVIDVQQGLFGANAFSKKVENHALAVALPMMYCNSVRTHKTLRVTPAMAAGVADRLWEIEDMAVLVEAGDAQTGKRGPYKPSPLS